MDKKLAMAVVVADPDCVSASLTREVKLNRNTVLSKIKVMDKKRCAEQGMVGQNIKKTSVTIKYSSPSS